MSNKTAGRHIQMFRCHYDPMIGPRPLNAFVPKDNGWTAVINDESTGVIVTLPNGQQHFVFGANIQSVRLEPEAIEVAPAQKKLGRPFKEA